MNGADAVAVEWQLAVAGKLVALARLSIASWGPVETTRFREGTAPVVTCPLGWATFCFAHRARCASPIRLRASADMVRLRRAGLPRTEFRSCTRYSTASGRHESATLSPQLRKRREDGLGFLSDFHEALFGALDGPRA